MRALLFFIVALCVCARGEGRAEKIRVEPLRRPKIDVVKCPKGPVEMEVFHAKVEELKRRYSIEVLLTPQVAVEHMVKYEAIPADKMAVADHYLTVVTEELEKVPAEFLDIASIKTFGYIQSPTVEGEPILGLALFEEQQLLFNIDDQNCAREAITDTLHHEMFHMFHNVPTPPSFEILAWGKLNEETFKYSAEGEKETTVNHPHAGFVSEYAMTDEGEDSAETYATMMVPQHAKKLKEWVETDEVLSKKVTFLKELLAEKSSTYTESYWEEILEGRD